MGHHPLRRDDSVVGLLLSERVDAQEGERIDRMAREAGRRLQRYTIARRPARLDLIHAAFFSRELYEGSSLREPGPRSNDFFKVVDIAENLEWLHVCSSGLDLPQYATSLQRGVTVTPSSGTTATPIAQTVLAAVMAHSRGFPHWLAAQSRRAWTPLRGADSPLDIEDQKALVLGAGPIGLEIGRLLRAVGFHTTVVRRHAELPPHFDHCGSFGDLDTLLPHCDWLILALPLTAETRNIIDARRLAMLRSQARLVNVARGELVDEAALISALQHQRLAGAYLDTFLEEPLPSHSPLWTLPNTWISPHNSAASQGHEQRVIECFLRELERWLRRRHPR